MSVEVICDDTGRTGLAVPGEPRAVAWENRAVELFESRMLDPDRPFPCVFGVDAVRRRTLRYAFAPAGAGRVTAVAGALRTFAAACSGLGRRTSLVVFIEDLPGVRDLAGCHDEFWALLAGVADLDDQPWPVSVDTDTENPRWEFSCFGVPFFVVANTPHHLRRRSRYFEYFAITFQPRFVFDDLAADTPAGSNSRRLIRSRLRAYDDVPPHAGLGSFGAPDNREWVQYFLPDDEAVVPPSRRCPLASHHQEDQS